ncbi:MAG: hypothetical protein ACOYVJ_10185 [Nitrospirota bacterium]
MDDKIDNNDFLIKEFEENWNYLRHSEEFRLKILKIYLLVYGTILGIVGYLAKGSENSDIAQSLTCSITRFGVFYLGLFLFLFFYGVALTFFQARQKNAYEHYRKVNASIRKELGGKYLNRIPFQVTDKLSEVEEKKVHRSPFFWWIFSMILINASALFFFFLIFLLLLHTQEFSALIFSSLLSVIACFIEWIFIRPQLT